MRMRLLMLIVFAFGALQAAAQTNCPQGQTTNEDVLFFAETLTGVTHVRVYDEHGKQMKEPLYDYKLAPADLNNKTYRPKELRKSYDPTIRYIATTASAGCVPGRAVLLPGAKVCAAWFELPRPVELPYDVIVRASPEMTLDATLTLPVDNTKVQCTTNYGTLGPGGTIENVLKGEEVLLTVRGRTEKGSPYEVPYPVNMTVLQRDRKDRPVAKNLIDSLKPTSKGVRGGLTLSELELVARKIEKKIVVSK
jgi:hypothetical protein